MKNHERLGPVDLMMHGRMDKAAEMYLDVYPEVAGDLLIGPHILSQLHLCVAGKEPGCAPEDATGEVEEMALRKLRECGADVDERIVKDEVAIARDMILASRERANKALNLPKKFDRWYAKD